MHHLGILYHRLVDRWDHWSFDGSILLLPELWILLQLLSILQQSLLCYGKSDQRLHGHTSSSRHHEMSA